MKSNVFTDLETNKLFNKRCVVAGDPALAAAQNPNSCVMNTHCASYKFIKNQS